MIPRLKRIVLTWGPAVGLACILYALFDWLSTDAFLYLTGVLLFLWCWAHDILTR
jgi:hypothetical protein